MTSSQKSSSADDDIRRSIDVLDQVLSEFDDIEPAFSDEDRPQTRDSTDGNQEVFTEPPPIDRSLKPKSSPPSLPQKTRKSSSSHESLELSPVESQTKPKSSSPSGPNLKGTQTSVGSKRSECSSHEYQEINNDFSLNARSRSLATERDRERQRHQSGKEHTFRSTGDRSRSHFKGEAPLRKSRSEDICLIRDEGNNRGFKNGRRHTQQRRGRSSDRFLDHRTHPLYDPRQIPELEAIDSRIRDANLIDPRFNDPRFFDPRFIDPRFTDCRFVDPTLQNQRFLDSRFIDPSLCDPRLLEAPLLDPPLFDVRIPFDGPQGHYPIEEPIPFPHIMSPPVSVPGTMSMPSPNGVDLHHHTIPFDYPLMQGPLLSPDRLMDYPYPVIDPHFEGGFNPHINGFDPRLKNLDPAMFPQPMRNQLVFPMDYPIDFPFNFPPEYPPMPLSPRERLHCEDQLRRFPLQKDKRVPSDGSWLPPTPDEARKTIQRIVRNQKKQIARQEDIAEGREKQSNESRQPKSQNGENIRRSKSASNSDSSGRSSPFNESKKHRDSSRNKNNRGLSPKTESSKGVFRVGEAVRKDSHGHREFGGKDTVSLPHFVSGGKDSGFDESPIVDEVSSLVGPNRGSPPTGVGGGFVVAGVFSDSSKMYIPAPPSPTPDYDNEHAMSDGEDSDIPQEPFYVKSKVKKENSPPISKTSSSSARDSLSEDSLQEIIIYEEESKQTTKTPTSLQSMIAEFRMGLPPLPAPPPPPHFKKRKEEGRFSDDSLEDDEVSPKVSPATTPTDDCNSKRPDSVESLESMDGSSTSFDYVPNDSQLKKSLSSKESLKEAHRKNELNNNKSSSPKKSMSMNAKNAKITVPKKSSKQHPAPKPKKTEQISSKSSSGSLEEPKKDFPKFDTIKHLIKEGLIEGLDETPPDFAPPPPPPKMTPSGSDERTDSGIGSTASTNNRTDESGGSDNQSDKLSNTPPKKTNENTFSSCKTPSPPPLPPPRDSSMSGSSCSSSSSQLLKRNQSWLYKKQESEEIVQRNIDKSRMKEPKNLSKQNNKTKREKITHVDDVRKNIKNSRNVIDNKIAPQYALPQDDNHRNELNRNLLIEKSNKLYANKKRSIDVPSSAFDEEASVSSHGSRSSRFFSRFTESMKSTSRSNSPQVNKNLNQQRPKKVGTKYHADIIRAPRVKGEAPQPPIGRNPPQFKTSSEPPSITPMNRDGSGRFRSIEDLPDISSGGKSLELKRTEDHEKKKKKNSTLPPTITPADVLEHEKETARNRNRDETDGSKFKFNIFKGFWRRNKYSFDKM